MRTRNALCAAALLVAAAAAVRADDRPPEPPHARLTPDITPDEVATRVAVLASDEFEGRESGTEGGRRTEEWVAWEMRRLGLEPMSLVAGSAFTDVPMTGRPVPEQSWIDVVASGGAPTRLGDKAGAQPFAFSKSGDAEGALVFAGFGISAPKDGYDDYEGLDVKGKVVLVLRHGPAEKDAASPWRDTRRRAREMAFSSKAQRAAEAGAAAILVVNDSNHPDEVLPVGAGGEPSPIPVFAVLRSAANQILAPSGKTIEALQAEIDADRKPHGRPIEGVTVRAHAVVAGTVGRNVVFVRRGTDPVLRDEAVLVCAHMDHVGRGFFGADPKNVGQIHNGADDNASGTAALLEVAEAVAAGPDARRSVVFAAWCGEEKGLLGSEQFADHPLWDLTKIAVVVNMDMLGRYRAAGPKDDGLYVCGMPTALGIEGAVTRLAAAHDLKVTPSWEAWEQSDQLSFYAKAVPALFLHTGIHADYHRPSDKWWTILAEPEARIARMVVDLTRELADSSERPKFGKKPPRPVLGVRLADAEAPAEAAGPAADPKSAPGPKRSVGARIESVVPGLGASVAGLQVGDVVTSFGGTKVESASDLGKLISASKEGDVVDVVFRRGAEERTVKVKVSGM